MKNLVFLSFCKFILASQISTGTSYKQTSSTENSVQRRRKEQEPEIDNCADDEMLQNLLAPIYDNYDRFMALYEDLLATADVAEGEPNYIKNSMFTCYGILYELEHEYDNIKNLCDMITQENEHLAHFNVLTENIDISNIKIELYITQGYDICERFLFWYLNSGLTWN